MGYLGQWDRGKKQPYGLVVLLKPQKKCITQPIPDTGGFKEIN